MDDIELTTHLVGNLAECAVIGGWPRWRSDHLTGHPLAHNLLFLVFDAVGRGCVRLQVEGHLDELRRVPLHDAVDHPVGHHLVQSAFRLSHGVPTQQAVEEPAASLTETRRTFSCRGGKRQSQALVRTSFMIVEIL